MFGLKFNSEEENENVKSASFVFLCYYSTDDTTTEKTRVTIRNAQLKKNSQM